MLCDLSSFFSDCRIAFSPAVIDFLPPAYRASLEARARDYLRVSVIEERLGLFNASDIPMELKVDALDSVMLLVYGEKEVEIMSTTELVDVKANATDSRVTFIFQSNAKKSPCVPCTHVLLSASFFHYFVLMIFVDKN